MTFIGLNKMANKTNDKKPTLADEYEAALQREREAYEKLSPEEQKKYKEAELQFQKRMDKTNYF